MAKYDPLRKRLRRSDAPELVLSFDDIEQIIGDMLPKSAALAAWWGNETSADTRHVQCRAWLDAGYEASLLTGQKVRFARKPRKSISG